MVLWRWVVVLGQVLASDPRRVPNTGLPAAVANNGIDAGQHVETVARAISCSSGPHAAPAGYPTAPGGRYRNAPMSAPPVPAISIPAVASFAAREPGGG